MVRPSCAARRWSWPAGSTGRWCARPRSMARATRKCSSCSSFARPALCRCRRVGDLASIHVDDLAELLLALVPGGEDVTPPGVRARRRRARRLDPQELGPRDRLGAGQAGHCHAAAASCICGWRRAATGCMREDQRQADARTGSATCAIPTGWSATRHACPRTRWAPKIGTREGLKATAKWYRDAGWL